MQASLRPWFKQHRYGPLALLLVLMGCSSAEPITTATVQPSSPPPQATPEFPSGTASWDLRHLPDDARGLMAAARELTFNDNDAAIRKIGDTGDASYVPVLIELLRFPWLVNDDTRDAVFHSLKLLSKLPNEQLTPEQRNWGWWVEWLGRHPEVQAPPGYDAWKGELFSTLIDRDMKIFFYEGVRARIRLEEIVWGGVRKDGIPDLTNPPVIPANKATYLEPSDRVFGVSINGKHRAYPLRILNAHEMANDVIGGTPFALAY